MPKWSRIRQRAALLTEVLIALALLIPVIVMVAGLFPYSFSVDRKAWNERTAQSLARSALEEARGKKFVDLDDFLRTASKDGTNFRVQVTVTSLGATPTGAPLAEEDVREKEVSCKVTWPRKNGEDTLVLETRVTKLYQGELE